MLLGLLLRLAGMLILITSYQAVLWNSMDFMGGKKRTIEDFFKQSICF
jgi:hypothetical protein